MVEKASDRSWSWYKHAAPDLLSETLLAKSGSERYNWSSVCFRQGAMKGRNFTRNIFATGKKQDFFLRRALTLFALRGRLNSCNHTVRSTYIAGNWQVERVSILLQAELLFYSLISVVLPKLQYLAQTFLADQDPQLKIHSTWENCLMITIPPYHASGERLRLDVKNSRS